VCLLAVVITPIWAWDRVWNSGTRDAVPAVVTSPTPGPTSAGSPTPPATEAPPTPSAGVPGTSAAPADPSASAPVTKDDPATTSTSTPSTTSAAPSNPAASTTTSGATGTSSTTTTTTTTKATAAASVTKATAGASVTKATAAASVMKTTPAATTGVAAMAAEVVRLTNVERAKAGCAGLTAGTVLTDLAQAYSADMAARSFFSHYNPEGRKVSTGWRRPATATPSRGRTSHEGSRPPMW